MIFSAYTTCGLYTTFVYLAGILGGIIADRYIGKKRSVLIGGIFQCIGHFLLAFDKPLSFFLGLIALVIGTGLLKSNISALLGSLYKKGDAKKSQGFSIFYMGINIGSVLAGFIVTTVAEKISWHYGFGLAGIAMLLALAAYSFFHSTIPKPKNENVPLDGPKKITSLSMITLLVTVVGFFGIHYMGYTAVIAEGIQRYYNVISHLIATFLTLAIVGYIVYIMKQTKSRMDKDRMIAFSVALLLAFVFFVGFEQASGLMTMYVQKYTNRSLWGFIIPASTVQNLNPLFVVIFSVWVSSILASIKKKSKNFNATFQMALGNLIMGVGFIFMIGACLQRQQAVDSVAAKSSLLWLVGAYFLHTIGELCLSPVILSFASNVAPKNADALIMGIVFAVFGLSNHYAAQLGALSGSYSEKTIFTMVTIVPILIGLFFMLINKKVVALTHGAEDGKEKETE